MYGEVGLASEEMHRRPLIHTRLERGRLTFFGDFFFLICCTKGHAYHYNEQYN